MSPAGQALFLIGATTMIVELVAARELSLILGSDLEGVSLAVAVFLLGLAGGSLVGARTHVAPKTWIVVALGSGGLVFFWIGGVSVWSHGWEALDSLGVRVGLALPLAVPAAALGAAVPAWFRTPAPEAGAPSRRAGFHVAALDLGSALGALATPLLLLPFLGRGLTVFAAGGILAAGLFLKSNGTSGHPSTPSGTSRISLRVGLSFLVGAVGFGLQIAWTRLLGEVLGTSLLVLGMAACALLVGGALGARLVAALAPRVPAATIAMGAASIWVVAQTASAGWIGLSPRIYLALVSWLGASGLALTAIKLGIVIVALVPPAVAAGLLLPALAGGWSRDDDELAEDLGILNASMLVGGTVGCLVVGLVIVPGWGSGFSLCLLGGLTVLLAVLALGLRAEGAPRRAALVPLGALLFGGLGAGIVPTIWQGDLLGAGVFQWSRDEIEEGIALGHWQEREILYRGEGRLARVTIERSEEQNTSFLRVGGRVEATVPVDEEKPSFADLPTPILLGLLAVLEVEGDSPFLVIGLGGGTTVATVAQVSERSVTVLEVEEEVVAALRSAGGRSAFPWETSRLFREGGSVRIVSGEARAFLHRDPRKWGAIICQPSEPWVPWSAPLFTEAFHRLVASRLEEGGVAVHWVQLYRIGFPEFTAVVRAFRRHHERVHIFHPPRTGEVILVGGGSAGGEEWEGRWRSASFAACWRRYGGGENPPRSLLDPAGVDRWLASRPPSSGNVQSRLEFRMPLFADRGEDRSGEILQSLEQAGN